VGFRRRAAYATTGAPRVRVGRVFTALPCAHMVRTLYGHRRRRRRLRRRQNGHYFPE